MIYLQKEIRMILQYKFLLHTKYYKQTKPIIYSLELYYLKLIDIS